MAPIESTSQVDGPAPDRKRARVFLAAYGTVLLVLLVSTVSTPEARTLSTAALALLVFAGALRAGARLAPWHERLLSRAATTCLVLGVLAFVATLVRGERG